MSNDNIGTMKAIRACAEARMPVMVVGEPGVGKTASIRALAESMNYEVITLLGSQMDPTDITGLPKGEIVAHDSEGEPVYGTVYLAPWWQVRIMQRKRVMLFLDEYSNTSNAVRASMLTMLQNREFPNGQVMPAETIVIGAMNPTEQAADGWELDKPTTNRITFLTWKTSNESWFSGMLAAWGNEASDEEMAWRKLIVRFLRDNPSYIHKENPDTIGSGEAVGVNVASPSELEVLRYAWASRRSWDNLSRLLSVTDKEDIATQDELASGTVGRVSAIAFREWLLNNSNITVDELLADPKIVDWKTLPVSEVVSYFRAITDSINSENWEQVLTLLEVVADADRQSDVAAYVTKIIENIARAVRNDSPQEVKRSRVALREIIKRYHSSKKSEQEASQ